MNEKLYPVYCGWCGELVGYSTVQGSTGICPRCAKKMLEKKGGR